MPTPTLDPATPSPLHLPAITGLMRSLGGVDATCDEGFVTFVANERVVIITHEPELRRLRIRVYMLPESATRQVVKDWVVCQPAPISGLLQTESLEDGLWCPRLLFERPDNHGDWDADPMHADIARYDAAWLVDSDLTHESHSQYSVPGDPADHPPANAWLLKGSDPPSPTSSDLKRDREAARVGIYTWDWTAASQTRIGDLVLFYFMSPHKAVHFVARAASDAFFRSDIAVNAEGKVSNKQWWAYFTNPIAIEPIHVETLRDAMGGYLPLRGRSGHYLRPEMVERLRVRALDPADQDALDRVMTTPVGVPGLPEPHSIDHAQWRRIAAGALSLEEHVSRYLVEPLLNNLLAGTGVTWHSQYRVGRGVADYALLEGGQPIHVIEVKRVVRRRGSDWSTCPDLAQTRRYADQLAVPSTLIDSHRAVVIERGRDVPSWEVDRTACTDEDLERLKRHLLSLSRAAGQTDEESRV